MSNNFSSHLAVVFIEYWYDRTIEYVKVLCYIKGLKGKYIDELKIKCTKLACC